MIDLERIRAELVAAVGDRVRNPPPAPRVSRPPPPATPAELAPFIDHTLLKADARAEDVRRVCAEARVHRFASVCVNAGRVALAAEALAGSSVLPIAVVGFPLGATSTAAKACEAGRAVADGAREIDMVLDVGALKDRAFARVLDDVAAVVAAVRPVPVKVILETGLLSDEEKAIACLLARAGGAAFVKTSTGFGPGGATAEDVALMRAAVGPELGVKASGGVRTAADALRMVAAGADRIGASASVAIVTGGTGTGGY
jgi:deoxyribose-phosphate aldolase